MGKWIEEYGETLLAGMAGFMIIMLVLTSGILAVIGNRAMIKENSYTEYQDFSIFSKICQREKPKIWCNTGKSWHVGEVILIEEVFSAEDADGKNLNVKVETITDKNGVNCMDVYHRETHQVIFQKAGIYVFEIKTQDDENQYTTEKIELSVDNRKAEE